MSDDAVRVQDRSPPHLPRFLMNREPAIAQHAFGTNGSQQTSRAAPTGSALIFAHKFETDTCPRLRTLPSSRPERDVPLFHFVGRRSCCPLAKVEPAPATAEVKSFRDFGPVKRERRGGPVRCRLRSKDQGSARRSSEPAIPRSRPCRQRPVRGPLRSDAR